MQRTNLSFAPASPAASSPREQPAPGGLCAIHQPNLFPRPTTLAKLFRADYWIVLDDVQFARRDYQHRARLAGIDAPSRQQWLTIPTHLPSGRSTLIRDALIDDADLARRRTAGMLRQNFGASPHWPSRPGPGPGVGCLRHRANRSDRGDLHPRADRPARLAWPDPQ
ncbi:WbqC family protein [Streptomyces aureocirculatus]|uniref:WbqC family protein n=1 Tax=Streptomyces aureocirculatus TaxID=67275 RepID=UPI00298E5FE0|nr:WbqC family protein [Streptomyces aureocirculatus]